MVAFIVFYGLDWVATVPPTLALCREHFGARAPVVFGWVFASHQLGAAVAAFGGGVIRDVTGSYDLAWFLAPARSACWPPPLSISIRRNPPPPAGRDAAAHEPGGGGRGPGPRLSVHPASGRGRSLPRAGDPAGIMAARAGRPRSSCTWRARCGSTGAADPLEPAELGSRKGRTLLRLLCARRGTPLTGSEIAAVLWPTERPGGSRTPSSPRW